MPAPSPTSLYADYLAEDGRLRLFFTHKWLETVDAPKLEWSNLAALTESVDSHICLTWDEYYHDKGVLSRVAELWATCHKATLLMNGSPCLEVSLCKQPHSPDIYVYWWQRHMQTIVEEEYLTGPHTHGVAIHPRLPVQQRCERRALAHHVKWHVQNMKNALGVLL